MLKRRKFPIWMAYLKTCKEYSHGERKWRAWPIRADGEFSRIILRPIRCSDTPYLTRNEHELEITVLKYVKESVGADLFFAFQFCNVSFSSPTSLLPSFHLFAPLPPPSHHQSNPVIRFQSVASIRAECIITRKPWSDYHFRWTCYEYVFASALPIANWKDETSHGAMIGNHSSNFPSELNSNARTNRFQWFE